MGEEVVAKYGRHLSEKVLRLFEETLSQEKFCSLREEWEMSEVEPGDIVHITGMDMFHFNLSNSSIVYPLFKHPYINLVAIYIPAWKETLSEFSAMPNNTTQQPQLDLCQLLFPLLVITLY